MVQKKCTFALRRVFSNGSAFVLLALTSMIDEIAQMALLLRQAAVSERMTGVASVLVFGMLGALLAGPIAARLITIFGAKLTMAAVFLSQTAVLLLAAVFADQFYVVLFALFLGASGSVYWSAVLTAITDIAQKLETTVDRVNSIVQTIRNFGFVAGPSVGAAFVFALNSEFIFLSLAGGSFLAFIILGSLRAELGGHKTSLNPEHVSRPTLRAGLSILLRVRAIRRVLWPFFGVVATTVPVNVGLVFIVTQDHKLPATVYGAVVACMSIGLVIGPALGTMLAQSCSDASIALGSGAVLGVALILISQSQSVIVMVVSLFIGGLANGAMNTTVASFVMKSVADRFHGVAMPAFVTVIQISVLCGYLTVAFLPSEFAATTVLLSGALASAVALTSLMMYSAQTHPHRSKRRGKYRVTRK